MTIALLALCAFWAVFAVLAGAFHLIARRLFGGRL